MKNLVLLVIFTFLTACSGYRFTRQGNPLSQYGIESLSVPMFYNYSNLPQVAPVMTRETFRMLSGFKDLKIVNGYDPTSDAVMIGIVKSRDRLMESLKPNSLRLAKSKASDSIGGKRKDFYIPGSTNVQLYVQIVVIKRPTADEIKLIQGEIGELAMENDRIIVNELLPVTEQFTREAYDGVGTNVINTQNKGAQRRTVQNIATQIANNIRDTILYAF